MKIAFCFFLCFLPLCIHAQHRVRLSGVVKETSGIPIAYSTISIENSNIGTTTNHKGHYTLKVVPGKYKIIVTSLGYKTLHSEIELLSDTDYNFVLDENPIMLETVSVHAKSRIQNLKESEFSVNAIDLKSVADRTSNINSLLNRSTGIRVRQDGGTGSDFDLSINGMSGNSVRYFIDGTPLDTKGGGFSLSDFPLHIIDRIEIYKGIVPAFLGADALGGAVNIITKRNNKNYLDVSYGIGSFHTHKFDFNTQYTLPKTDIIIKPTLGINYSENDYMMKGVELWDENERKYKKINKKRFHDDYLSVLAQLEGGVTNKKWADDFFISASITAIDKELQTGTIQSIVYGMAERRTDAFNLSARYLKNNFLIENLKFNSSISYTWDHSVTTDTTFRKYKWDGTYTESFRNEITGRGKSIRHYKRPLLVIRSNVDYKLNESHGFNFNYLLNRTKNNRYDDVDNAFEASDDIFTKQIFGLSYSQSVLKGKLVNSFFIKDYLNRLSIGQQDLSWITGSKDMEKISSENYIGYGVGSRYSISDIISLKASFEHSIRLPLARELLGNGTTVYPNFKLKPESSNNVNLGAFGTFYLNPDHRFNYEINTFYRNVKDYIRAVVSESEGLSQYDNVAAVDIKGVEGELKYTFNNTFQFIGNCSWQHAVSKTRYYADGSPMITYNNKIPNRPWLFGNAELNYTKHNLLARGNTLKAAYNFDYVHWFFLTWEGYGNLSGKSKIPTQYVSNVALSCSIKNDRYSISLMCDNIFDRLVYDNYMLQKPGRSFMCKFRIFINN